MARTKKVTEEKTLKATPKKAKKEVLECKDNKCTCGENCNCENCNCECNSVENYIKYIFYTTICIFVCAFISTIFIIIMAVDNNNTNKDTNRNDYSATSNNGSTNNGGNQEQNGNVEEEVDYDVSMFTEINTDELIDLYNGENKSVIYIGRKTCGYCVAFLPSLQQAQEELGYQTYYYDISKISNDDYDRIIALNSFLSDNFGYTPMVLVVQNGQILSSDDSGEGWVGYAEYETFKTYLQGLGY